MGKRRISIKNIICIIFLIILVPILFVSVVIFIDAIKNPEEIPSFFGWKPFIVLSDSMNGTIDKGDLIIVKECDTVKISQNDIISFQVENHIVITHRVQEIKEEDGIRKYITKGDNNSSRDEGYVVDSQIEGIYMFKLDGLGNVAMFVQTPIGMLISLGTPVLLLILVQYLDTIKLRKKQN